MSVRPIQRVGQLMSLQRVGQLYARASTSAPHTTAGLTAAGVVASADLTCQTLLQPSCTELDRKRTLGLTCFAAWHYGGPAKFLYLTFDRVFCGPELRRAALSVAVDVYAHTPFLLLPSFYVITGYFKDLTLKESVEQLRAEWWVAAFGGVLFWTPVCFFNFRFVPQHSRILFVSCMSFIDKLALSWWSNRGRQRERLLLRDGCAV